MLTVDLSLTAGSSARRKQAPVAPKGGGVVAAPKAGGRVTAPNAGGGVTAPKTSGGGITLVSKKPLVSDFTSCNSDGVLLMSTRSLAEAHGDGPVRQGECPALTTPSYRPALTLPCPHTAPPSHHPVLTVQRRSVVAFIRDQGAVLLTVGRSYV